MWRNLAWPRFTFPVAVNLKRLAAPLCVFNFGIVPQKQLSAPSHQPSVFIRSRRMSDDRSGETRYCSLRTRFFPTTRAWRPALEVRWAHCAPQPCASLSLVPSPSSSAPISHEEYFLPGGDGTLRCFAVPRL